MKTSEKESVMKRYLSYVLPTLAVGMLVGCATSYKADGFSGGFSEIQVSENVWRVSFRGNGYTRTTRAEELALLRSADIATQNDFRYFAFIDSRIDKDSVAITTPSRSTSTFNASTYGGTISGTARTRTYGGDTTIISKPSAINTVAMFKERPQLNGMIYDAKFICDSLGKKYEVKCGVIK